MKVLALLFLFTAFPVQVFAQDCEVYGISDSPQTLTCKFGQKTLKVTCDTENGTYLIDQTPVQVAYHEEVERGPVPLIFKTEESTLKVMMYSSSKISANFVEKSGTLQGSCKP